MDTIFTYKNILKAYRQCIKKKRSTTNALRFELNRERNLAKLLYDLKTRKYNISRHICFIVTYPSPREIFAADFRDRIVHHLLCNEIQGVFEKDFSNNLYSNRKYYGTHRAVEKVKWYMRRGGINGSRLYFLKMDIRSFFRSIDKKILWEIVKGKIQKQDRLSCWKEEVLWLSKLIIFHNPVDNYIFKGRKERQRLIPTYKSLFYGDGSKGLPIGNLTSQFFANVYLSELDGYIEKMLRHKRYVRYVDDFVIFDESVDKLKTTLGQITNFCKYQLNLQICTKKTILRNSDIGIDFLGYYIKPTHTLVRRKVLKRFKYKFFDALNLDGFISENNIPMIKSYLGHFYYANSWKLRNKFKI